MGSFEVGVERTLVMLQMAALVCMLSAAILRLVDAVRSDSGLSLAIVWLAFVPAMTILWFLRPRMISAGRATTWTALAVLLSTPIAVFGTLNFTIPVLLLVVAFAVVDVSLKAGLYATTWISFVGFALHISGSVGSWDTFLFALAQALVNVVPAAVLLCFGIALGLSLRSFEVRRIDDQNVIARLRHATEMEKELLLSDERARSARDLHDGLGHRLTLVSISLELAERLRETDLDQAWEEVRIAKETSGAALSEMRMWVRALSPVRDAGAHGLAALELIAESFRGTGLHVTVSGDDASDRILVNDDAVALLVYRTVQEGLTNALRHGQARTVGIFLTVKQLEMHLTMINDLGSSAASQPSGPIPKFGFGLRGIAERAAEYGGAVQARRGDGEFRLDVVVPVSGAATAR